MNQRASRQNGFSVIEGVLSLALMAIASIGLGYSIKRNSTSIQLAAVASQLGQFRMASDRYVQDNYVSLMNAAIGENVAVPLTSLINGNYLPPSFPATNSYSQVYRLYVHRRSATVLESMALTTGGTPLSRSEGGAIAALLKSSGGFAPANSATATGTKASWTVSLASFVPPGSPAPSGNPVAYSIHYPVLGPTGALIRYATGNPSDNRMSTNLDMAHNDINNVGNLGAVNVNATNIATNALTIGGQAVSLTDAQTLAALSAASCGSGYALSKSTGGTFNCVAISAVPSGVIAAFETSCPAGWSAYTTANDRVLVAAGGAYSIGQIGGADSVALTSNQMPRHSHHMFADANDRYDSVQYYPDAAPNRAASGSSSGASYSIGGNRYGQPATRGSTEAVGEGQPFDNRQPYIALNFCKRQ